MLIPELYTLLKAWKITRITPHDLINWVNDLVILVSDNRREINGTINVWVFTGSPDDWEVPKESEFYKRAEKIVLAHRKKPKQQLVTNDIIDTFISKGKVWIVLRDGRVIDEETVRVKAYSCGQCRTKPPDDWSRKLFERQDDLCMKCFTAKHGYGWNYVSSTCNTSITSKGYCIFYEPVTGSVKEVTFQSDLMNRIWWDIRLNVPVT